MEKINIAIDGPAAAGKSTVAKKVAEALHYTYIDTGAMYRAATYLALKNNANLDDEREILALLKQAPITLSYTDQAQHIFLGDVDVTDAIRTDHVSNNVSLVATHKGVRREMVKIQREMIKQAGVVMDGRDIGTHVITDAAVKIFMIASVDERAERRYKENVAKGYEANLEAIKADIRQRDKIDQEREVSPLVKATDAIELDTTSQSIDEVTREILAIIKEKVN
ncbi:cytidylate kinase [Halolactibacillus halophilus]|uniref:Cytidylate kinase n=1 Tax=Halolactibacillus halophilus TaxID=306540 RepID=A0A1I5P8P6_9BACI|nr:(d)CMP kinase [Halolactibacillus halophilus]GEM01667.1 cytidylate kinase [Halolactibacillus halophilus]SFP30343.1 cytidylate kinase [Halolactibacillus halophilus]